MNYIEENTYVKHSIYKGRFFKKTKGDFAFVIGAKFQAKGGSNAFVTKLLS